MTENILSQDEVNALLQTIDQPTPPVETATGSEAASEEESLEETVEEAASLLSSKDVFPRLRSQTLTEELQAALALVHDGFAYSIGSTLSVGLRAQTHVKLESMQALSHDEFLEELPEPSSVWALRLESRRAQIMVCFQPLLVHTMIDFLMGGAGLIPKGRESITDLDQAVIRTAVESFCKELNNAWQRMLEFDLEIDSHETRPGFLHIRSPNQQVILITLSMIVGQTEGQVFLGIPESVIDELSERLNLQSQTRNEQGGEESIKKVKEVVLDVSSTLEANLSETMITASELLRVRVGDVIKLDHRITDPISITVNGLNKFSANVVASNKKRVIEIV